MQVIGWFGCPGKDEPRGSKASLRRCLHVQAYNPCSTYQTPGCHDVHQLFHDRKRTVRHEPIPVPMFDREFRRLLPQEFSENSGTSVGEFLA